MPPADFSYLRSARAPTVDRTRKFKLYTVKAGSKEPLELELRSAVHTVNTAYFNARAAAEASSPAFGRARREGSPQAIAAATSASRMIDAELFPAHVIVGWTPGTVLDRSGAEVPFTIEDCAALLAAVLSPDRDPHDLAVVSDEFDELRMFAKVAANWTSEVIDAAGTAKNSGPGSNGSSVAAATGSRSTPG